MITSLTSLLTAPLPQASESAAWSNLHGAATGLSIASAVMEQQTLAVIVLEDPRQLHIVEREIRYFLTAHPALPILNFPSRECLPYDVFSPHPDITSERLHTLSLLPGLSTGIILVQAESLLPRIAPTEYVTGHTFNLQAGDEIGLEKLRQRLVAANYSPVHQVMSPGEFAVRGGLLDLYPMGTSEPYRLDFYDDELESIRTFDPESQRSRTEQTTLQVMPASEYPLDDEAITRFRANFRKVFACDPRSQAVYRDVSKGFPSAGVEFYLPLFFEHTTSLFDYLPPHATIFMEPGLPDSLAAARADIQDRFENLRHDPERRILPPDDLYLGDHEAMEKIAGYGAITLHRSNRSGWNAPFQHNLQLPVEPRKEEPCKELVHYLRENKNRILLAAETTGRMQALDSTLRQSNLQATYFDTFEAFMQDSQCHLGITVAALDRGLNSKEIGITLIVESQLYGERVYQRRRRSQASRDPASIVKSLTDLGDGDPVVHIEHGVGRYRGLSRIEVLGDQTEYITVEYHGGDKLYLPVLSLHLISRFVGGSPDLAPLHHLGGEQWEKTKRKAQEKAYDVAAELLEVQALREARDGLKFVVEESEYQRFCSGFAFEETPDQAQAISEVITDLMSDRPMDRLVCGDVGFGKTEVALRAAFIVATSGRQVCILTPTTLLAQQHYDSFINRFSEWPVRIGLLSRFNTQKQSSQIVAELKKGKLDIVIGTHRIIQKDIRFHALGLVIIDEEHRFGVRQKEQLKQLRSEVDILTLTATPIPRTLNITMSGLRSISIIATPPASRVAIKTFVREYSDGLVKEACLREIRRGGQIFFLHNDVRTIARQAEFLRKLIPEAEINIGHGQMPEMQLERVMQDFYHQRFNILVCSTIIESGIDIPTANTIIIDRAERFGLAQLHQLRGRVGRSRHQAFAYLLIPGRSRITADAAKRLDAIDAMTDLGAGFALASHDLEIRGAGELLGETQSGLIDDVGFALYSEYLAQAVESIKSGKLPKNSRPRTERRTEVDLHLPALFPADYLGNPHSRLILYKRIANAQSEEALKELQIETIDRFGLLPDAAQNLFRITAIRLLCQQLDIKKLDIDAHGGLIEFHDNPVIDPLVIFHLIRQFPDKYALAGANSLKISYACDDHEKRMHNTETLLQRLMASVLEAEC